MQSTVFMAQTYGQADVLEFQGGELPALAVGMARILVRVAGIHPIDADRMTGAFRHAPLPQTWGTELAAEMVALNLPGNVRWTLGGAVLGSGSAFTQATAMDVPLAHWAAQPPAMPWEVTDSLA